MADLPSVEIITSDVYASAVYEVAVSLKSFYKVFDPKTENPEAHSDQEFKTMAESLVKTGKFTAFSGEEISRDQAIADLEKVAKENPDLKETIQSKIDNLKEIPDDETLSKAGNAIHSAMEKSTSFFDSFTGFLQAIINYIMGFIDWLMDGGKQPMMHYIGERFAANTSDFVKGELEMQSLNDPKLAALLTPERIDQIGNRVEGRVVDYFTGEKTTETTDTRLANTKVEASPIRGMVMNAIDAQIEQQFMEDIAATRTTDETGPARAALAKSKVGSIDDVKNAFQSTLHEVVQNEDNAKRTNDKLREIIAKGVTDKLDWDKQHKSWLHPEAWFHDQGGETLLKEAIEKGADGRSMLDDAMLTKLKDATNLYHHGVGGTQLGQTDPTQGPPPSTPGVNPLTSTPQPRR